MKRFFAFFFFLFLPFLSFCADGEVNYGGLEVTWIDANTIRITGGTLGPGNDAPHETVVTNFFGTCTNCVNISPSELRDFKVSIAAVCSNARDLYNDTLQLAQSIQEICINAVDEISHYVRFDITAQTSISMSSNYYNEVVRQNPSDYSYVHGTQGRLTHDYFSELGGDQGSTAVRGGRLRMVVAYSNAIYDYGNYAEAPTYSQIRAKAAQIETNAANELGVFDAIENLVDSLSEEPCQCSDGSCSPGGGGSGSGGTSFDCPCKEQLEALKSYTSSIAHDVHLQYEHLVEMKAHLGSIDSQLKSYADAITSVFLNDGTIFVDSGANSWSNVYVNGYSELYGYNKSNILQRIELLLYGLAFASSSSTNAEIEISVIEDSNERLDSAFDDALSTIDEVNEDYESHVSSVGSALRDLWSNLNFLGAGQLQNFSLMEPTRVFDEYDLEFEFSRAADFSDLRTIVRTSFQVFYLLGSLAFIIVFWLKVVNFIYEKTLFVLDFFNKVLT